MHTFQQEREFTLSGVIMGASRGFCPKTTAQYAYWMHSSVESLVLEKLQRQEQKDKHIYASQDSYKC